MLILMCNFFDKARKRPRILVNPRVADIFKGILQTQKSAKSAKKSAKRLRRKICRPGVYHAGINHNPAAARIKSSLKEAGPAVLSLPVPAGQQTAFLPELEGNPYL
jgi:hypothetical protein